MIEFYSLMNPLYMKPKFYETYEEFSFNSETCDINIGDEPFLGFKDSSGHIYIYNDETCLKYTKIDATVNPKTFIGHTILEVKHMKEGSGSVIINLDCGSLIMRHEQNCCEAVELIDVTGNPQSLVGGVIGVFEVRSGTLDGSLQKWSRKKPTPEERFSWRTYTFYEIRTTKGDVTLRWGEPKNHDGNRYGEEISLIFSNNK